MSHHFQRKSASNMDYVKKLIAQAMPKGGADGDKLVALLHKKGVQPRTAKEMLRSLQVLGEIEWDTEKQVWKLPTVEAAQNSESAEKGSIGDTGT